MARKSRKLSTGLNQFTENTSKSRAGIYVRLSVKDNGYQSSDSLENQIALLKRFIQNQKEEFELVRLYVDNGTTGTDFDRKEWNHLIEDIKSGEINCIMIKDFSRIGRNYIEVGTYLEEIFPSLGVRVVAVNENFDSKKQSFENSMLIHALTNIVNEYYARDISVKITQSKRTMQKNGEYAGGICPYGYKKSEQDRKKLVKDKESADIVKKIFAWRIQGWKLQSIADALNILAIPSPGQYRYLNGNLSFKRSCNTIWKTKHIAGILENPVYLGHMVQGKTRSSYFEHGGKRKYLPKEEWIIAENTHEPLITREQFNIATGEQIN